MFSEKQPAKPRVMALLPAAGLSRRMGDAKRPKLLAEIAGESLLRRAAKTALASRCASVQVISGHLAPEITAVLADLPLQITHNPDYRAGMATSLRLAADLAAGFDGLLVLLPDMPFVTAEHINEMIAGFDGQNILRACHGGTSGNPVLIPARLFKALQGLEGDCGAKALLEASGLPIVQIDIGAAALIDLDTPEAMARHGARPILLP